MATMKLKLVGMALALALVLGVTAPPASADAPREFYGVTPQTKLKNRDFSLMRRANVGTLRYNMSWGDLDPGPTSEPEVTTGLRTYRWYWFDPIVYLAAQSGVRVLPTVYGTPYWIGTMQGCPAGCYKLGPSTPAGFIAFAQFMQAATARYGPGGTFWDLHPRLPYKPIRTWQIWNEMNSSDYWKPEPNLENYADLLIYGSAGIKSVDPRAQVILGGMIGEPGQEGKKTVSGWNFLRALYDYPGAREAFDGIAVHPYGASINAVKGTIYRWREELERAGALADRIWVTEVGWASGGGDHPLNRGLKGQAELLTDVFDWFTHKRKALRIANVDYYAWRDAAPGADHCLWCAKSGLLRYNHYQPKPAWRAFLKFTR
jgi:hypothetical protein